MEIYYSDNIKFENIIIQDCIITEIGAGIIGSTAAGNVELINVTVDNIETQDGGNTGAWINETTFFSAQNCTFSNNTCTGDTGFSAGLYAMSNGDISVENSLEEGHIRSLRLNTTKQVLENYEGEAITEERYRAAVETHLDTAQESIVTQSKVVI